MGLANTTIKIFNYVVRWIGAIRWYYGGALFADRCWCGWGIFGHFAVQFQEMSRSWWFDASFLLTFQNLTGILVGFSTGKCQLMTNRGKVIISQQWLPEPVQSIQIPNGKKAIDEIYVVYQSSVCILQTKQLMQSIRNFEKLGEGQGYWCWFWPLHLKISTRDRFRTHFLR